RQPPGAGRPVIVVALSQRLIENDTYRETREALDVRWGELATRLGLLPLVLPTATAPEPYFERFAPAGLILTGGNDLASTSPNPLSERRDRFEARLLALAMERDLPVLAVCRGMQLVGEVMGGTVVRVAGHAGGRHPVTWDRATR